MPKSAAQLLRAMIAEHKSWIEGRETFVQHDLAQLYESLSNDVSLQSLRGSTVSLDSLGHYYARVGTTKVVEGDQSGWDSIRLSIAYYFWTIKIRGHAAFNTLFLSPVQRLLGLQSELPEIACLCCYLMATDRTPELQFLIDLLVKAIERPELVDREFWDERYFEPFVLELFRKQTGVTVPEIDQAKLGPYSAVLENWDDADRLEPALFNICDYHCRNMEDDFGDWKPEFDRSPFDLLPIEIFAIFNVRKKMGLTNPQISHPLMQTPLASMPPSDGQLPSDRVLEMIERAFNSVFTR